MNNQNTNGSASAADVIPSKEVVEVKDENSETIQSYQFADQAPIVLDNEFNNRVEEHNAYINPELSDYLGRVYPIEKITWTASQPAGSLINETYLPGALMEFRAIAEKLARFTFLKCKFHISVRVNGTAFHYGKLLVGFNVCPPSPTSLEYAVRDNIYSASAFPHVIVSPGQNEVQEFDIPFIYPLDYYPLTNRSVYGDQEYPLANIFTYVLNPLSSSTPVPDVNVTIFANMFDVTVAGYGNNVVAPFIPRLTPAAIADRNSRMPRFVKLGTKPRKGKDPEFKAQVGTDRMKLALPDYNRVSTDGISLTLNPTPVSSCISDDARIKSLHQIISRPALIVTDTITSGDVEGTDLLTFDVDPMVQAFETVSNGTIWYSTPLSFIGDNFNVWRGTINYKLQIVCSQFHSGRIQVIYYPSNATYDTNEPYELLSRVIDIQRDTEFKFSIPYTDIRPYVAGKIGTLVLKVVNTLTFKEDPVPDIYYNIWVSAGKDFEWILPNGRSQIVESIAPVRFRAQVGTGNDSGDKDHESLAPFTRPVNTFPLSVATLDSILAKANVCHFRTENAPDNFILRSVVIVDGFLVANSSEDPDPPVSEVPFWTMIALQSRYRRGGNIMIVNSRPVDALDQIDELGDIYAKVTMRATASDYESKPLYCAPNTVSNIDRDFQDTCLVVRSSNLSQQPMEIYIPSYLGLNYALNTFRDSATNLFFGLYPSVQTESTGPYEISLAGAKDLSFFFQIGPPRDFIYVAPPPP
jgi:hypothetical protein